MSRRFQDSGNIANISQQIWNFVVNEPCNTKQSNVAYNFWENAFSTSRGLGMVGGAETTSQLLREC